MDTYLIVTYNAGSDVAYPEGEFPSEESAINAAREIRQAYPLDSSVVREGWFTRIDVVLTDGIAFSPHLYRC